MKKINIFYWICTGIIVLGLGIGSVFEVISYPDSVKVYTLLGYPAYLAPFLGSLRLLALAVILVPRYPRLKEWAYAGITFDLVGALYSQIVLAKPFSEDIGIIALILFLGGSYILQHKKVNNGQGIKCGKFDKS